MPTPDWSDVLNIGLPILDEQHKQLFKDIFDRLKAYTKYHFKEEEAYMKRIGYPKTEEHSAEHVLLLMRVNTLWRLIENGEIISPKGVSLFVSDWIVEHIMDKDGQIGQFAKAGA
jgi:hemerythrin-like metal-binding protein